jgi:hypothetical protein
MLEARRKPTAAKKKEGKSQLVWPLQDRQI